MIDTFNEIYRDTEPLVHLERFSTWIHLKRDQSGDLDEFMLQWRNSKALWEADGLVKLDDHTQALLLLLALRLSKQEMTASSP